MDEQIVLVRKAIARDSDAFIAITDPVKHKLYHTARAILGNETDACEALDEAMFKAWQGIHKLKHPEYFSTWITTILIRESQKLLKRQKRELMFEEIPETADEAFDTLPLHEAVRRLPENLRDIICLRFFSDMTVPQISQVLSLPEGTVKTRQRKALSLLRVELEEESI